MRETNTAFLWIKTHPHVYAPPQKKPSAFMAVRARQLLQLNAGDTIYSK